MTKKCAWKVVLDKYISNKKDCVWPVCMWKMVKEKKVVDKNVYDEDCTWKRVIDKDL